MKHIRILVGICLLFFAYACRVFGSEDNSNQGVLSGTWECIAHGSVEGDVSFWMKLEQNGETLTGSIGTNDGEITITSGSYKNNLLEIHCDTPDANYLVTGKLQQDRLTGHWAKGSEQEGAWEGKRSSTKQPGQ